MTVPIHRLDLREDPARAAAAVGEARRREADRFLVLDTFAGLPGHQLLYERLLAHDAVPTLCVAVGAPADPEDIAAGRSVLRRPLPLRPPGAGVVWVPDPTCGDGRPEVEEALRPLVDLLAEPAVFDAVLLALSQVTEGVAVPALDVLEQCLTPAARGRVWRESIERLVGQEPPVAAFVGAGLDDVPAALVPLVEEGMPRGLAGHEWLRGRPRDRQDACTAALDAARDAFDVARHPLAPLTGAGRRVELPLRLEELADALDAYRETAVETLREGDLRDDRSDQRGRLFRLGVNLPETTEGSREPVGPALRSYTESRLRRGVSLRSTAARLAALAQRAHPVSSAARVPRLDEVCPAAGRARLRAPHPFPLGSPSPRVNALESGGVALLAGLWPVAGWALGPAVGLACVGVTAFLARGRPNRDLDGRLDGGVVGTEGRLAGGVAGGLLGALAGQLLGPPVWLAGLALALSVLGVLFLGQRWWVAGVDGWWEATGAEESRGWRTGIGEVLVTAAARDWFLRDAREHCAAVAATVAGTLHVMADAAERHATPGRADRPPPTADWAEPDDWGTGGDFGTGPEGDGDEEWASGDWSGWEEWEPRAAQGPPGDGRPNGGAPPESGIEADPPPWLRREAGDGGERLVETVAGDLTAGALHVLGGLWGTIEAAPENPATATVTARMTGLLDDEARRLDEDPASPPAFAPEAERLERRPGPAALFGLGGEPARALVARRAETPGQPLCGRAQRNALSRDPSAARRVCFAPESVRGGGSGGPSDGWDTAGEDMVWTGGGRFTGVARLLPLRRGFVGTPYADGEEAGR
ncbi:hypothetical protein SAMN06297387_109185 [Streptomyces zhaozhouensis]|uniref:Uncharacterized protein n=1 Tax=Streptomyces zhaozhouensis TaxID=1300267 RepID=A0A286DX55_9ACTN|nr:hypothetical protein [Streptomyces zhaozhouensis]SOD63242.1 hypothetical protein SAMN06297387_109185 [Streptomyces zhaozhouensis]